VDAGGHIDLREQPTHVRLHRGGADVQVFRDLAVGPPLGHKPQHVRLPVGGACILLGLAALVSGLIAPHQPGALVSGLALVWAARSTYTPEHQPYAEGGQYGGINVEGS